jgi:hypothetical protein
MKKTFKIRASAAGQIMGIKALGKTGENYCENWVKEQLYKRRKEFGNKYTEKGLIMEDTSIDFVADELGYGFLAKNEKFLENDFFTGTPDIILNDHVIDVKNSWDCFTFPLFDKELPNKDYFYQAQVYLALTGLSKYKVIYTLTDTPMHLIEKEAYFYCKNNGYDELEPEILDEFIEKMTYSDIPNSLKIKVFEIEKCEETIDKLKNRVIECRNYIKSIEL